jgi:hypothetical protein
MYRYGDRSDDFIPDEELTPGMKIATRVWAVLVIGGAVLFVATLFYYAFS